MKFTKWKENVDNLGKKLNSICKVTHHLSINSSSEYYNAQIDIKFFGNILIIEQGFVKYNYEEGNPGKLILTYKFHNKDEFNVIIYERTFFERIFNSNRILTKNQEFDKQFSLKSTDERKARKIFEDKRIQKFFLENRFMTFYINTEKFETEMRLKYFDKLNYENDQVDNIVNNFKSIIEKINN